MEQSMIGRVLGHFRVEEKLGSGGMGVVYRGRDTRLGREVALKFLSQDLAGRRDEIFRFEREARLLASLNHPNIAAIHGLEECDGLWFLVLEYVPGNTIGQTLKEGPLPAARALEISRQVAEALAAAHDKGIVHRDLKPENVKVTPEGKVKLLDFGIAKAFGGDAGAPSESMTAAMDNRSSPNVILGTGPYISPEQLRGEPVGKQTDIWQFGCLLFEMLADARAFGGGTVFETAAFILTGEPDWNLLPAELPIRAVALTRSCLQKQPAERLSSISDAIAELDAALADVRAGGSPPPRAAAAAVRARHGAPPAGSAPNAAAPATPASAPLPKTEVLIRPAVPIASREPEPPSFFRRFGIWILAVLVIVGIFGWWMLRRGGQPGEVAVMRSAEIPPNALSPHTDEIFSIAFADGGKMLLTASGDHTVKLWNVATGQVVSGYFGHTGKVHSVAIRPDGKQVATASADGVVRLWNQDATGFRVLRGHRGTVAAVAFSPDGRLLASAGEDTHVRLWDTATGSEVATMPGHSDWVRALSFSPDGSRLASASDDTTVRVWNVATRVVLRVLSGHSKGVSSVAFTPDGRQMASGTWQKVHFWEPDSAGSVAVINAHEAWVSSIAFNPVAGQFATSSTDGSVKLWDLTNRRPIGALSGHERGVASIAFSPDGRVLATGSWDKTARIWDVETRKQLKLLGAAPP